MSTGCAFYHGGWSFDRPGLPEGRQSVSVQTQQKAGAEEALVEDGQRMVRHMVEQAFWHRISLWAVSSEHGITDQMRRERQKPQADSLPTPDA